MMIMRIKITMKMTLKITMIMIKSIRMMMMMMMMTAKQLQIIEENTFMHFFLTGTSPLFLNEDSD